MSSAGAPPTEVASTPQAPIWLSWMVNLSPALTLGIALPFTLVIGLLVPGLGPFILLGCLGIAGGIVSVLRPGIGLFLFTLMMYTRASEVLTTSIGLPSIAPLFTIWLLTGIVLHFGIGGLFHARPTGWQALVLYGIVLLASTLVATNPAAAMTRVVDYVRELVYIALIVAYVRERSDLQIVVRALIVAGVIPAILTIYQTLTGSTNSFLGFGLYSQAIVIPGEIVEVSRPAGMVGDPNFYAMALIALIPLAFHRARWERTIVGRQLAMMAALVLTVASIMTYSRGGYLTLAVVVACLTVVGFIRLRSLMIVGLLFVMLLPILPATYSGRALSLLEIPVGLISQSPPERGTATDTSVSGRVSEVMAGVHMFLDHPILGVGTHNYQEHYQEYSRPMGVDRRTDRAAHSLYVEIAAETGIIGIMSFGAFVVTLFVSLRRVWTTNNRGSELHDLALIVATSLAALLVASIFLHFAYPRFFMVFAGLTLAIVSVQNWRLVPHTRLDFSRLQPTQPFLTDHQHQRLVVWGGAAAIVTIALVSALMLNLSVGSKGQSLVQRQTAAAIRSPSNPSVTTPVPSGGMRPDGTATSVTPTVDGTPTATSAVPPTVSTPDEVDIQAELLSIAMEPVDHETGCIFSLETEHNVCGDFAAFFDANGDVDVFGAPLSEQYITEGTLIQYFERARFEWHPEVNGEPGFVTLSRLGALQRAAETGREIDPPALPAEDEGCIYEDATGHNVCGQIAFHWVSMGGMPIFGYPITEKFTENGVQMQYFERARIEIRPAADGGTRLVVASLGEEEIERILSAALQEDGASRGN